MASLIVASLAWMLRLSLHPSLHPSQHSLLQSQTKNLALSLSRIQLSELSDLEFAFEDDVEEDDDAEEEPLIGSKLTERAVPRRQSRSVSAVLTNLTLSPNATVAQLQQQLKQLGQRSTGSKPELLERLRLLQRKHAMGLPINDMEISADEDMQWYMLQTANGFERTVERTIMMAVQAQRLHEQIEQVFVPILEGETSVRDSSVMPSYIFVRMRMNQELHFLISSLQYVVSFVGADRGERTISGQMQGSRGFVRPMPLTQNAFNDIVQLTKQSVTSKDNAAAAAFAVDDMLQVLEGPFKGLQGPVLEIGDDSQTLTIALTVMGRDTPVDLPVRHVIRVDDHE